MQITRTWNNASGFWRSRWSMDQDVLNTNITAKYPDYNNLKSRLIQLIISQREKGNFKEQIWSQQNIRATNLQQTGWMLYEGALRKVRFDITM